MDEVEPAETIVRRFSSGAHVARVRSRPRPTRRSRSPSTASALARTPARAARIRRASAPSATRGSSRSRPARFGVTPEYARIRRRAADQDRAGLEAGRGRPAPGHKVTDEIARLRHTQPGRRADLAAAAPRHLLDRGSRAARSSTSRQVEPGRATISVKLVAEAGVGLVAAGVRQGARRRRPHRGRATAAPARARSPRSSTRACRGSSAWPRRSGARRERAPRARAPPRRRRAQDRARRRRRRAPRRRRGGVRHCPAARRGLPDGPLVPPRHVPGRHRDPAARAARQVRRDPGAGRGVSALRRRGSPRGSSPALGLRHLRARPSAAPTCCADARRTTRRSSARPAQAHRRSPGGIHRRSACHAPAAESSASDWPRDAAAALEGRSSRRAALLDRQPGPNGRCPPRRRDRPAIRRRALRPAACARDSRALPGQSFGAFLAAGVELELVGEANDYVGKGMSGGRIVVLPSRAATPATRSCSATPCSTVRPAANCSARGRAGERFAVRNSGATAVVEGVGDHALRVHDRRDGRRARGGRIAMPARE